MLNILKDSLNTLVFTNSERTTGSEIYLIEFVSEITKEVYRCIPTVNTSNSRFLKLEVFETRSPDQTNGQINLLPSGSWLYNLYIGATSSLYPTTSLIESGYAVITENESYCLEIDEYTYLSDNETGEATVYLSDSCGTETLTYRMTLADRASNSEYYMFEFESNLTAEVTRCFPIGVTANNRYVELSVVNDPSYIGSVLGGTVSLSPSGSYTLRTYITDELSITPTTETLVDERYVQVNYGCEEVTTNTYVSDNEDAETSVFLATTCFEECQTWNLTEEYFQLDDEYWNCTFS